LYVNSLIDELVSAREPKLYSTPDAARVMRQIEKTQTPADRELVRSAKMTVQYVLGSTTFNTVDKLSILLKGPEGYLDAFKKATRNAAAVLKATPIVKFPDTSKPPSAALEILKNEAENNISTMSLGDLKILYKMLGVPAAEFKDYVRLVYIPATKVQMVLLDDESEAFVAKNDKISASKVLTNLNGDIEKGKPLYVPRSLKYEYIRPASKAIFFQIIKHFNSILPNVKWRAMTGAQIELFYGKKYRTDKGFFKSDGEIIINLDKVIWKAKCKDEKLINAYRENLRQMNKLGIATEESSTLHIIKSPVVWITITLGCDIIFPYHFLKYYFVFSYRTWLKQSDPLPYP